MRFCQRKEFILKSFTSILLVSVASVSAIPTMRDAQNSGHPVLYILFIIVAVGFACWWNNRK